MQETKATHAPGPWREYDREGDDYRLCDANGLGVAMVFDASYPPVPGRTAANARLIAAAPEQHDFVKEIVSGLSAVESRVNRGRPPLTPWEEEMLAWGRKLLEKVNG